MPVTDFYRNKHGKNKNEPYYWRSCKHCVGLSRRKDKRVHYVEKIYTYPWTLAFFPEGVVK